jgi:succinate dehydrogenase / fumarate reductase, iron-sulfur subunit
MTHSIQWSGADGARTAEIKIRRYQPEQASKPYWQTFEVEVEGNDRLLDVLNKIKWEQDGTLTFRRSCAHGVCGSDTMRVNGRNRLACKLLMADVGQRVMVEAMLGYPVIRDLVVDMDPFFAKYEKVKPYLINDEPQPLQPEPEREPVYDDEPATPEPAGRFERPQRESLDPVAGSGSNSYSRR